MHPSIVDVVRWFKEITSKHMDPKHADDELHQFWMMFAVAALMHMADTHGDITYLLLYVMHMAGITYLKSRSGSCVPLDGFGSPGIGVKVDPSLLDICHGCHQDPCPPLVPCALHSAHGHD